MRSMGYISAVSRGWHYLLLALILLTPTLILLSYFNHFDFSLPTYSRIGLLYGTLSNSLIHLLLAVSGSLIIGVPMAWLSSVCRFSGMESLWWALLIPMAIPTFTIASIYEQSGLFSGFDLVYRMAIYSSLSLYPLVYLVMRIAFSTQNREYIDGSRCLGTGAFSGLFRVGIGMNRPAIVAASLLVAMDVLSDIATPRLLDFQSLSYTIYNASSEQQVRPLAVELTTIMLASFLLLLWFEDKTRGNRKFHQIVSGFRPIDPVPLSKIGYWLVFFFALAVLTASLLYPLMELVTVPRDITQTPLASLIKPAFTSISIAFITAVAVIGISVIICFGLLYNPSMPLILVNWLPSISLVIPGSVLALLVLTPLETLDNFLSQLLQAIYLQPVEQPLQSSMLPVIYLLVVKFLAIGTFATRIAIQATSETMDQASRSLGNGKLVSFMRIHLPFLLPTLAAVFFLVFSETIKEAAIVLILMPESETTLVGHLITSISDKGFLSSSREIVLIISIALFPALLLTAIINLKKT